MTALGSWIADHARRVLPVAPVLVDARPLARLHARFGAREAHA